MSAAILRTASDEAVNIRLVDDETEIDVSMRGELATGARRRYLLAGRAVVTLRSARTGTRFTFKVSKKENDGRPPVWFVSLLTGPSDFSYLGTIFADGNFRVTGKSRISAQAPAAVAFAWFIRHVEDARVEAWHEGSCGRCGRRLTVPESIASGLGPTCAGRE